ncbi:NLR family CARD domain-containing protein 3 [Labeo rohita]|uniref:NLR family CARD domain-containing protein 3 n=1 Tax=Labeo rohita TaxID=84645 RepID=A0ABQ8MDJ3_LABRO|nr:NLR family CARD domain-containing protein 3 [Labeo rohita]
MDYTQTSRDEDFSPEYSLFQQKTSEPEPSWVSMKSESIGHPVNFKSGDKTSDLRHEVFNTFRSYLMKKFEHLYEGTATQGNPTLLNEIYTELYITESQSGQISNEHEVRQIETQSRRAATEETAIKCNDIFRPLPGQDKAIRTVLTKGVADIGKTVSVQKFILDWAEGKENQDVQLIFPLPFREINLMKDKTLSLLDLLHVFIPETKEMEISSDKYKMLFIFDGLDECRLSLHFESDVRLCDVSESDSVDVLLMNLIVGNLLPSALIWITSRPAAADLVPSDCVHRVTEVRGFNEPQKEEYFRKRISDRSLANTIISHLKSSRSLYIMCHIPVFCWISAAVLEKMLSRAESGEIPKTLTQMYTHFLILQTNIKCEKDYEKKVTNENMILKLGKVAFQQLMKGNLIFYEEDLRECGIDVTEASVYSGLCTQIFREEFGLYQGKRAVDEALKSKNGYLDIFLRFLLGLSVESHQILLRRIMTLKTSSSDNEKTAEYIKKKIRTIDSPEKSINLFHCLNELEEELNEFRLDTFVKAKNEPKNMEVLLKLLPVMKESSSVQLSYCGVTDEGCAALVSPLRSNSSYLRHLDLSWNKIGDTGVKLLSAGLEDPCCKLEKLHQKSEEYALQESRFDDGLALASQTPKNTIAHVQTSARTFSTQVDSEQSTCTFLVQIIPHQACRRSAKYVYVHNHWNPTFHSFTKAASPQQHTTTTSPIKGGHCQAPE